MDEREHGLIDGSVEAMPSSQSHDGTGKGVDLCFPVGANVLEHRRFMEPGWRKRLSVEVVEILIGGRPECGRGVGFQHVKYFMRDRVHDISCI